MIPVSSGNTDRPLDPVLVTQGKDIFRFDTFGNEVFWTDTARMHEVITGGVSPATALAVGLRVDADALPAGRSGRHCGTARSISTIRRQRSRC